ncbi:MAG: alpha-glucan family phosphorylase [Phycisphaeraceae bacterium]|nr:alpha-glucan family phosphorylase [Phycisphaeraceae bacterium]
MISPNLAKIHKFKVTPSLPEKLKPLLEIANNLWWTWHPEAVELFVRLDRPLWQRTHHNPVAMLGMLPQETLERAANDEGFLDSLARAQENLKRHLIRKPWHESQPKVAKDFRVAYFCAEYGMTESLQVYSGGLGCLAGDHLKSASELGIPLIAVGLLYRFGYFQQYLNAEGWQQEFYPDLDFPNLPTFRVRDANGQQLKVSVDLLGRQVKIGIWKCTVGRIPLYLLDTNLPENAPEDRAITDKLYGGDMEHRIRQEVVLGIGGTRALEAMGETPTVYHMNEGHSAFLALERIRKLIEKSDLSFDEAREAAGSGHVFTTHTPVPAGIDRFPPDMMVRYFKNFAPSVKLDMEGLLALGRENVFNRNEFFSMAVLAIRTSQWCNGVSKLHGEVSRRMWQSIWPKLPETEIPIKHVTNGVHARSWLSGDLSALLDRYLGIRWQSDPVDHEVWSAIQEVPDEELWRVHERRRQSLIIWARRKLRDQLMSRGSEAQQAKEVADALSPYALTIGFARRFATYKRGTMLLRDPERLMKMLSNEDRPIQFLIAGKSHPADGGGKDLIRQIVQFARDSEAGHKIVFLENYDIHVARYLVQGCDVWLNTPRRGMEASGTSGMKAALNGVLNLSVMDGWWDEAFDPEVGWQIGKGEEYSNPDYADDVESKAVYDLLEKQIIPLFYERDDHGIPRGWVAKMKTCISRLAPRFNTNRMVQEYAEKLYFPAADRAHRFNLNKHELAITTAARKRDLRANWGNIAVEEIHADTANEVGVHSELKVQVIANVDGIDLTDLRIQAYYGLLDNDGCIVDGKCLDLEPMESLGHGRHRFSGNIPACTSGRHGFAIRIVPGGPLLTDNTEPGMVYWDEGNARVQGAGAAPADRPAPEPSASPTSVKRTASTTA